MATAVAKAKTVAVATEKECARCHIMKDRDQFSAEQWDQGAHRVCEACLQCKECARCHAPKPREEYEVEQWFQGKRRVCKACVQGGYNAAANLPLSPAVNTTARRLGPPTFEASGGTEEGEPTSPEGLASGLPRATRGVRKAAIVSRHTSSDFLDRHYETVRELGKGAFGKVTLVRDRKTGQERVCKLVPTDGMPASLLELMQKEIDLLCQLDHPGVVKIFEYALDEKKSELVIVLEYLPGGDCFSLLEQANGTPLTEALVGRLVHQTLLALCYCHSQGVVHRDVKPENMMLNEKISLDDNERCDCKLIDFGVAAHNDAPKRGLYGTAPYMAPDVAVFAVGSVASQVKDYTPKADVWSLGVTVFELLMDQGPFHCGGDRKATFRSLLTYSHFSELEKKFKSLPVWRQRSGEARSFLSSLLVADPSKRPTAAEALQHPWIRMHVGERHSLGIEMIQGFAAYQDAPAMVRCCLYVIAARLGVPDLERFGATFLRIDKDGDGKIVREDLDRAFSDMEDGLSDSIDIDAILKAADLDHSGGINFTEFVAVCLYARHAEQGSLDNLMQQAFDALDDDRDGLVTLKQVRSLFRERDAPGFQWLPQDRPFSVDEWFSCLRSVSSSESSGPVLSSLLALEVPFVPQEVNAKLENLDFSRISDRRKSV